MPLTKDQTICLMKIVNRYCLMISNDYQTIRKIPPSHIKEIMLLANVLSFVFFNCEKNFTFALNPETIKDTVSICCFLAYGVEQDEALILNTMKVLRYVTCLNTPIKTLVELQIKILAFFEYKFYKFIFYKNYTNDEIDKIYTLFQFPEINYELLTKVSSDYCFMGSSFQN